MQRYRLFARPGWGSAIVEAQLEWYGLPYDIEEVPNLFTSEEGRRALARHNPTAQVPALTLPDGSAMTESAAITLHLADATGRDDFVPGASHPARPQFLRWLVFFVANIYPTFTFGDEPGRYVVGDEEAAKRFGQTVDEYRVRLWRMLQPAAGAPWFLGERMSALDLYVAVMTHWRPGRRWFEENAPGLAAIARRSAALPALDKVWRRNFPKDYEPPAA